jgi:hypothetical protein
VELCRHALDKLDTYGISGERLASWQQSLHQGTQHLDLTTAARIVVTHWEGRPWVVVLSQDGNRVITTYPTDQRTVTNRLESGRWITPNT